MPGLGRDGGVPATPDTDPRGRDRVGTLGGTVRGGHNSLAASNLFPGFHLTQARAEGNLSCRMFGFERDWVGRFLLKPHTWDFSLPRDPTPLSSGSCSILETFFWREEGGFLLKEACHVSMGALLCLPRLPIHWPPRKWRG